MSSMVPLWAFFRVPHMQDNNQPPAQSMIDQVRDASMSWGFFQLVNHGVSQQLLDEHYEVMKR